MEKVVLGIDIGNGFTKYDGNRSFASRVTLGQLSKASESQKGTYEVVYDGESYIVGLGNEFITNKRHLKDDYLICMLTAISIKSKEDDVEAHICIGVPIETLQNTQYIQKIKDTYNTNTVYKFKFNNTEKNILIKECSVFTESAAPFIYNDHTDQIVIDVGTGTISVAHWNKMKIVGTEFHTYNEGMYIVCNKIAKELKNKYNEDVRVEYIQKNLGNDVIKLNNTEYDFKFHKKILERHITSVVSKINTDFQINEVKKIRLMGGGANITYDYWKEDLGDNVLLEKEAQFVNAKVYQKYAELKSKR